jgi:acyl-CoA thioester hydrolase
VADATEADSWVVHPHRVIYGDTDAMGIVYYANYLRFFEIGRTEYVRARGALYRAIEADGLMLPVSEAWAKYLAPARYDDVVNIHTRIEELGHATLRFEYRLVREADEVLLAKGYTVHACLNRATGKVTRMPLAVRGWLTPPTA